MQKKDKTEIDLWEFVRNGKFDILKIGQSREWVLNNFPKPDFFENGESWKNGEFEIFSYGDFELHFSNDILFMIFADFTGKVNGGKSLVFSDKWILKKETSKLNLTYVIDKLLKEKIDFSTKRDDKLNSIILKTTKNIEIHFEADASTNPEDYYFSAIWKMDQ